MKVSSVLRVMTILAVVVLCIYGTIAFGDDATVTITPEPLKVAEQGVLGKALTLRYSISSNNESTVFRVRFEAYGNGKGPRVLWDGRVPVTSDGKGRLKVLLSLSELPPRVMWDPECAIKAPEDSREFYLASMNGELAMIPVPPTDPGQTWSWRGSGSQKLGEPGFAVLAVGVLDKVFPRLPIGWERNSDALKRVQESHCAIIIKGRVE